MPGSVRSFSLGARKAFWHQFPAPWRNKVLAQWDGPASAECRVQVWGWELPAPPGPFESLEKETVMPRAPGSGRTLAGTDPPIGCGARGPNGPAPTPAPNCVWVGGQPRGSLRAGAGGRTHRRSVFRGMFFGMACSPVPWQSTVVPVQVQRAGHAVAPRRQAAAHSSSQSSGRTSPAEGPLRGVSAMVPSPRPACVPDGGGRLPSPSGAASRCSPGAAPPRRTVRGALTGREAPCSSKRRRLCADRGRAPGQRALGSSPVSRWLRLPLPLPLAPN